MARGVDGRIVFIDDTDREAFLRLLDRVKIEAGAVVYAYCLMGNHFHLALKVATASLGCIMQRILTGYVITFNRRHDRTGHLFQARYKAIICVDDHHFLGTIQYIQMNPVRAGLVENAADWPWSSRSPMELPDLDGFEPWPSGESRPMLIRPEPERERTLDEIGARIVSSTGIGLGAMRSGSKSPLIVAARVCVAREGAREGHRLTSIASWLNVPLRSVSYYLTKNSSNC